MFFFIYWWHCTHLFCLLAACFLASNLFSFGIKAGGHVLSSPRLNQTNQQMVLLGRFIWPFKGNPCSWLIDGFIHKTFSIQAANVLSSSTWFNVEGGKKIIMKVCLLYLWNTLFHHHVRLAEGIFQEWEKPVNPRLMPGRAWKRVHPSRPAHSMKPKHKWRHTMIPPSPLIGGLQTFYCTFCVYNYTNTSIPLFRLPQIN